MCATQVKDKTTEDDASIVPSTPYVNLYQTQIQKLKHMKHTKYSLREAWNYIKPQLQSGSRREFANNVYLLQNSLRKVQKQWGLQ